MKDLDLELQSNRALLNEVDDVEFSKEKDINDIDDDDARSCASTTINEVTIEAEKPRRLYYKISENPPFHLLVVFALQQGMMSLSGCLIASVLVSQLVCAEDDELIKAQILSSTMFMTGITTFLMVTIGVRLPVFQGPATTYIIPMLALSQMEEWTCLSQNELGSLYENSTLNATLTARGQYAVPLDMIHGKLALLMGSLMGVGVIHTLIGATGLVGLFTRFIGPITIVPSLTLIGLYIYKSAVTFAETQWGVAAFTSGAGIIFSLYLRNVSTPLPAWNRKQGFHIFWFPFHQVFAILLAIILGWLLSVILTETNSISDDPLNVAYNARTDSRNYVIRESSWFYVPYPGQFGYPQFNSAAFMTFLLATLYSVLDSIGDYIACARMCFVPPPPTHAVNRGIFVEGIMSFISGAIGIGHATASYGANIGAIGLTRVASRRVFQGTGILVALMGIIGKVGAVFVTIPYSVIGGTIIIGLGIFVGIVLSNLQYIDLNSPRNLAIIGISLLLGLMLPYWVEKTPGEIQTGVGIIDRVLTICLSNPIFVGGSIACFLDNTVPGTVEERGLIAWLGEDIDVDSKDHQSGLSSMYEEGYEVYDLPFVPKWIKRSRISKFIPILPNYYKTKLRNIPKDA